MAKNLIDMVIPEISPAETVLAEGVLMTQSLMLGKQRRRHTYKYAITDQGVWTRNPKRLFFKPKSAFIPYSGIKGFMAGTFRSHDCCIFFPKNSRPGNRIYFDNHASVIKILDTYLSRITE